MLQIKRRVDRTNIDGIDGGENLLPCETGLETLSCELSRRLGPLTLLSFWPTWKHWCHCQVAEAGPRRTSHNYSVRPPFHQSIIHKVQSAQQILGEQHPNRPRKLTVQMWALPFC